MKVSLVMTYIGQPTTLERCLKSLESQTRRLDETIIVDGNKERLNENDSMNLGIKRSHGSVIMTTNADCYVPHDWVERHLEWHRRGFDLVSGLRINIRRIASSWNPIHDGRPRFAQGPNLGYSLSNASFNRRVIEAMDPITTRSGRVWDSAMSIIAVRSGYRLVIDPQIIVRHDHEFHNPIESFLKARRLYRWNKEAVREWGRSGTAPSAPEAIRELTLMNGVKAWKMYPECRASPLPSFLLNRILFRSGQLLGFAL